MKTTLRLLTAAALGILLGSILAIAAVTHTFATSSNAIVSRQRETLSIVASEAIAAARTMSPAERRTRLDYVRHRYGIASIEVAGPAGRLRVGRVPAVPHKVIQRSIGHGETARLTFDDSLIFFIRQIDSLVMISGAVCVVLILIVISGRIIESRRRRIAEGKSDGAGPIVEALAGSLSNLRVREQETERLHEIERRKHEELARVSAILTRNLSAGFLSLTGDGFIIDINEAARRILDVVPDHDLASRPIDEVLSDTPMSQILRGAIANHEPLQRVETTHRRAVPVGMTAVPLFADHGGYLGMIVLLTDLTEVRRLEQQVRDLQTLADLGEMAASIAHEFRNSLSTITGYLRLAARQEGFAAQAHLRSAETEASVLAGSVDALLSFGRPVHPEMQSMDLSDLTSSIVSKVAHLQESIEFASDLEPRVIIDGDPRLLARAIENVLLNAVEAVLQKGHEGRVEVRTRSRPPELVIEDNGVGIDASAASRLFLPFHTTKSHGSGLGLALARKIVLLHGGTIQLTGNPGEGASLRMSFPPRS